MLQVRRVDLPPWRGATEVSILSDGGADAYQSFQPVFWQIIDFVHAAVVDYVNDATMTFETGRFPARDCLSGQYYIYSTYYHTISLSGSLVHAVKVSCACTETSDAPEEDNDYLGLDVVVNLWRDTGRLEVDMVSSSSI